MYRIVVLILAAVIIFSVGCDDSGCNLPVAPILDGQWQWVQMVGGIAGETRTPESTGDQMRIEFTERYTYDFYRNDTLLSSEPYVIKMMPSVYLPDSVPTIYIEGGISQAFEFSALNDSLYLFDNCYDCFAHVYYRIR